MLNFKSLFEKYDFSIEQVSPYSFIADNGIFCVPYTEFPYGDTVRMAGVSFLSCNKEDIKSKYKKHMENLGFTLFADVGLSCPFYHVGGICNHDNSLYEVEEWLQRISKKI